MYHTRHDQLALRRMARRTQHKQMLPVCAHRSLTVCSWLLYATATVLTQLELPRCRLTPLPRYCHVPESGVGSLRAIMATRPTASRNVLRSRWSMPPHLAYATVRGAASYGEAS